MRTEELFKFIRERHAIYERRSSGLPKPWTDDPILQNYRFCNVYRELDTQTVWLADNWRMKWGHMQDFWFASLMFRFVNWHETAEEIGWYGEWNKGRFLTALQRRKDAGVKRYSGAYMISTHGVKEDKATYLAKSLSKIWKVRADIRWQGPNDSLDSFHRRLMGCFDVGSFLAAQVVADVKYAGDFRYAKDWYTFAASGPGSRRGLNRVFDLPLKHPKDEATWRASLREIHREIEPLIITAKMPCLHAQDLQNCLCEFDKYERARLGEGRPKQKYKGGLQ